MKPAQEQTEYINESLIIHSDTTDVNI